MTEPDAGDPGDVRAAFAAALAGAALPADRDQLVAAATQAGAPEVILSLLAGLDDTAPFASVDQAWAEAAGPDGS
ncbi:MAG: DUF2795 domain-containing protein [Acidimicrobiales bacterium]